MLIFCQKRKLTCFLLFLVTIDFAKCRNLNVVHSTQSKRKVLIYEEGRAV